MTASKQEIREQFGLPLEKKIIAYVGKFRTMGESKGVEELIASAGMAAAVREDIFLLIAGLNTDEFDPVERLTMQAGLTPENYRLVGHVPHASVPLYLRAADLLVMNYPDTEHYAQIMLPIKTLEYMASGTPIISSDLPSIRDLLNENNATMVPPGDVNTLLGAITSALDSYNERLAGAARARMIALEYTWQRRARQIIDSL